MSGKKNDTGQKPLPKWYDFARLATQDAMVNTSSILVRPLILN